MDGVEFVEETFYTFVCVSIPTCARVPSDATSEDLPV